MTFLDMVEGVIRDAERRAFRGVDVRLELSNQHITLCIDGRYAEDRIRQPLPKIILEMVEDEGLFEEEDPELLDFAIENIEIACREVRARLKAKAAA